MHVSKVTRHEDKNHHDGDRLLSAGWLTVPGATHDPTEPLPSLFSDEETEAWSHTGHMRAAMGHRAAKGFSDQEEKHCMLVLFLPSSVIVGKPHDPQSLNFLI